MYLIDKTQYTKIIIRNVLSASTSRPSILSSCIICSLSTSVISSCKSVTSAVSTEMSSMFPETRNSSRATRSSNDVSFRRLISTKVKFSSRLSSQNYIRYSVRVTVRTNTIIVAANKFIYSQKRNSQIFSYHLVLLPHGTFSHSSLFL